MGRNLGSENPQIEPALKFLREIKLGQRTSLPEKIVIIGGGAVAMDCGMSAVRLGADTTMVILEQRDQMLIDEVEVQEALEDGVKLLNGWSTKEYVVEDGELRKLLLQRCVRVFDDNYRPALKFDSDDTMEIEANLVVTAIGQDSNLDYLSEDIGIDERRNVLLNMAFQTSAEGVFAAGDIKAPALTISAVAAGKRAAMSIDTYLKGSGIYFGRVIDIPETRLDPKIWDYPREQASRLEPATRRQGFAEVESTFNPDQARREAYRCMRCDRNSAQGLFLRTFPNGA